MKILKISKPYIINAICIKTGGDSVVQFLDFYDDIKQQPYTDVIPASVFTPRLLDKLIMDFLDNMACMNVGREDNIIDKYIFEYCNKNKFISHTFIMSNEFKYRKLIDKKYNEIELNIRYIDPLLAVKHLNIYIKEYISLTQNDEK